MLPIILLGAQGPNFVAALQQLQNELQLNYSNKACRIQQILVCQELVQPDVIDIKQPRGALICHLVALLVDSRVEDEELKSIELMKPVRAILDQLLPKLQTDIMPILTELIEREAERYTRKTDRQEKQENCTHEWDILYGKDMRTGMIVDANPHDPISVCALCELKLYMKSGAPIVGLPKIGSPNE